MTLTGHTNWVSHVCVSPDSRFLVTSSVDRTARIWQIPGALAADSEIRHPRRAAVGSPKPFVKLDGHTDSVWGAACTSGIVATCSKDMSLRLWDADTGEQLAVHKGAAVFGTCRFVGQNGRVLLSGSNDHLIRLYVLR